LCPTADTHQTTLMIHFLSSINLGVVLTGFRITRPLTLNVRRVSTSNFSLQYHTLIKYTGHENKVITVNEHQTGNVLTFNQILPTSNIRNISRTVRRICTWIMGLEGFSKFQSWVRSWHALNNLAFSNLSSILKPWLNDQTLFTNSV